MSDYRKKRMDMVIGMIAALTEMSEEDIQQKVENTAIYQNILDGEECTLYESYLANIMDIVSEVRDEDAESPISILTPQAVAELNQWMLDKGITDAAQLKKNMAEWTGSRGTLKSLFQLSEVLTAKLTAFDAVMQEKILAWLNSARKLLQSSCGQTLVCWNNDNVVLAGTRGMKEKQSSLVNVTLAENREGCFKLVISGSMSGRLVIRDYADYGEPVCLVIVGVSDVGFMGIYKLSSFGTDKLRTQKIELPDGEYDVYIPINK